ncbi:MAG: DNA gyrase inhibitor YacG [Sphingopyxis sp.]
MPIEPRKSPRPCPLCGKAAASEYRPFCSRGCRDRDLNAWFGEDYRIAVPPAADEGDAPPLPDAPEQ